MIRLRWYWQQFLHTLAGLVSDEKTRAANRLCGTHCTHRATHQCDVTAIPAEQFDRLLESDEPEPSPALQRAVQQYHAHQCGEKK